MTTTIDSPEGLATLQRLYLAMSLLFTPVQSTVCAVHGIVRMDGTRVRRNVWLALVAQQCFCCMCDTVAVERVQ